MKYFLTILFLTTFLEVKAQGNTDSLIAKCYPEVSGQYFNETYKQSVFIAFRIGPEGMVEEESINILHHLTPEKDAKAVKLLLETSFENTKIKKKRNSEEIECITIAISFHPESPGLYYDLVNSHHIAYKTLYQNDISSAAKGKKYFAEEKYDLAYEQFRMALSKGNYGNAELHYYMFQCLNALGDEQSACIYLEQAKNIDPTYKSEWKEICK
ncbi:hypothetical protein [Marivirga lumbricoides]